MLSEIVQEALNQQINMEFSSSYDYLGMAAYCERYNLRGFAHWFGKQSAEEYGHGMKLYNFVIARGGRVVLQGIEPPQQDYGSIRAVFDRALTHEIEVSDKINSLYELAFAQRAFATLVELEWFIKEQVEEEYSFRHIVSKLELIREDPAGLLDLDRELGQRAG